MNRKIGILGGTGPEGSGLAYRWARAGEEIVIGSRDAQRAAETAAQLLARIGDSAKIEGADNATTASQCEVVVVTVPFSGCATLLKQLKSVWKPGTVVIDGATGGYGWRICHEGARRVAGIGSGAD